MYQLGLAALNREQASAV